MKRSAASSAVRGRVQLRITPGAARTRWIGPYGDRWKLQVAAPPERGRANEAVCRAVAEACGCGTGDVTLVAGETSRDKTVEVRGRATEEIGRLLAFLCSGQG